MHPRVGWLHADLGTTYLDQLLLHYPECWGSLCSAEDMAATRGSTFLDTWRAFEELYKNGLVRSIGAAVHAWARMGVLLEEGFGSPCSSSLWSSILPSLECSMRTGAVCMHACAPQSVHIARARRARKHAVLRWMGRAAQACHSEALKHCRRSSLLAERTGSCGACLATQWHPCVHARMQQRPCTVRCRGAHVRVCMLHAGVSNFGTAHLTQLLAAAKVKPQVLQVRLQLLVHACMGARAAKSFH